MQQTTNIYDLAILGGGIVGLATAYQFVNAFPGKRVVLLEKEAELATHQTGRNSGVLHSGIYYKPGSLKAKNCRAGRAAMVDFCRREEIPHEICGKVIVATSEEEIPRLKHIQQNGIANQVQSTLLCAAELAEHEPHAAGVLALHVPETGIVDYVEVSRKLAQRIQEKEGTIVTNAKVTGLTQAENEVTVQTTAGDYTAKLAVNCTGLYTDRTARLDGCAKEMKIVPFRGEYFKLRPEATHLVRNLIYPVPDPAFPFLGVHFTRMVHGGIECGPNAVFAFSRQGYRKRDIHFGNLTEALTYPGFLRLAAKNWKKGVSEMWRSVSKPAFVKALQRLLPEISSEQIEPAPAGVRAQAVAGDGTMIDDFLLETHGRILHVLNAPSPAATASLTIGEMLVERLKECS